MTKPRLRLFTNGAVCVTYMIAGYLVGDGFAGFIPFTKHIGWIRDGEFVSAYP